MDEKVLELIATHDPYLIVNAAGKIECTLNGHAMPARADAIQAFVKCVSVYRAKSRRAPRAGLLHHKSVQQGAGFVGGIAVS